MSGFMSELLKWVSLAYAHREMGSHLTACGKKQRAVFKVRMLMLCFHCLLHFSSHGDSSASTTKRKP